VLISPALGTGTQDLFSVVANGAAAALPSEATAAWYNKRGDYLSESLEQVAQEAQRFRDPGALSRAPSIQAGNPGRYSPAK
jgi:hypothetical protein